MAFLRAQVLVRGAVANRCARVLANSAGAGFRSQVITMSGVTCLRTISNVGCKV